MTGSTAPREACGYRYKVEGPACRGGLLSSPNTTLFPRFSDSDHDEVHTVARNNFGLQRSQLRACVGVQGQAGHIIGTEILVLLVGVSGLVVQSTHNVFDTTSTGSTAVKRFCCQIQAKQWSGSTENPHSIFVVKMKLY